MPKASQLVNGKERDLFEIIDPFCGSDESFVSDIPRRKLIINLYTTFYINFRGFKEPFSSFHGKAIGE